MHNSTTHHARDQGIGVSSQDLPTRSSAPADSKLWRYLMIGIMVIFLLSGLSGAMGMYYYFGIHLPIKKQDTFLTLALKQNENKQALLEEKQGLYLAQQQELDVLDKAKEEAAIAKILQEESLRRRSQPVPPKVKVTFISRNSDGEPVRSQLHVKDPLYEGFKDHGSYRINDRGGGPEAEYEFELREGWLYLVGTGFHQQSPYISTKQWVRATKDMRLEIRIPRKQKDQLLGVILHGLFDEPVRVKAKKTTGVIPRGTVNYYYGLTLIGQADGKRYSVRNYLLNEVFDMSRLPDQVYVAHELTIYFLHVHRESWIYEFSSDDPALISIKNGKIVSANPVELKLNPDFNQMELRFTPVSESLSSGIYYLRFIRKRLDGTEGRVQMLYRFKGNADPQFSYRIKVPIRDYRVELLDDNMNVIRADGEAEPRSIGILFPKPRQRYDP